jgi:hypothetical protein
MKLGRNGILGVLSVLWLPLSAMAQFGPFPGACGGCHQPMAGCHCAMPAPGCAAPPPVCAAPIRVPPTIQTTLRPVVDTHWRPQQYTACQTVTRTLMKRQAETVTVPVTVNRQVTVDEGCYQLVWVPKPVTRNVPETRYQQQVCYRDVPYQVTQQVPTLQTRMVPYHTVRYVRETQQIPGCFAPPVGCAVPGSPHMHSAPSEVSPPSVPPAEPPESGDSQARRSGTPYQPYAEWETDPAQMPTYPTSATVHSRHSRSPGTPQVPRGMFSPASAIPTASRVGH